MASTLPYENTHNEQQQGSYPHYNTITADMSSGGYQQEDSQQDQVSSLSPLQINTRRVINNSDIAQPINVEHQPISETHAQHTSNEEDSKLQQQQQHSTTHNKAVAPRDKYNLLAIMMTLLGIGVLIPCNTYILAIDFFRFLFPTLKNLEYIISCTNNTGTMTLAELMHTLFIIFIFIFIIIFYIYIITKTTTKTIIGQVVGLIAVAMFNRYMTQNKRVYATFLCNFVLLCLTVILNLISDYLPHNVKSSSLIVHQIFFWFIIIINTISGIASGMCT